MAQDKKSTRTPEQEQAIAELRAEKAAAKAAAEAAPAPVAASTVVHELEEIDEEFLMLKTAKQMSAALGLPSWKRGVAAMIASMSVAVGIGYGTNLVVGIIMAGAVASSYYFIAMALAILACLIGAYLGLKYASRTFGYIATSTIDEDLTKVKDKVFGWFKSKPVAA